MARARNIKPGFFKNEVLAEMPCEIRLLFIGLWTLADREGRIEDRPKRIKMEIFAYDSFDVDPMLNRLQSDGFLVRYEVNGIRYIQITNFVKHQDPHYKEKASEIPPPYGESNIINATSITRSQRSRILERDNYTCQASGCGATEHLCIDHIIPASRGGDSSDENLQVLCLSCNTKKGNKLDGETKGMKKSKHNSNAIIVRSNIGSNMNQTNRASPSDSLIPDSLIPDSIENTFVASDADDAPVRKAKSMDSCPHQEIISLYAEILPELPQPRIWDGERAKSLTARWRWVLTDLKSKGRPAERENGLDFFRRMFGYIRESDFLMGRSGRWSADLGWIVKAESFAKILQGNYDNKIQETA